MAASSRKDRKRYHILLSSFNSEEKAKLSLSIQKLGGTYLDTPVSYWSVKLLSCYVGARCAFAFRLCAPGTSIVPGSAQSNLLHQILADLQKRISKKLANPKKVRSVGLTREKRTLLLSSRLKYWLESVVSRLPHRVLKEKSYGQHWFTLFTITVTL